MSEDPVIQDRVENPSTAASRDYRLNKLSFEALLASFAATFITLRGDDVDTEIEAGMMRILEYLDLDRSTVIQGLATRESDDVPRFTHSCAREGFAPLEKTVVDDYFPWLMSQLGKGEIVVFSSLDELPPEAEEDRESIRRRGACSMAAIPFITQGEYFGALVFTTVGREREWDSQTIQRLHLTGQIFCSVILRKRAELAARKNEKRLLAVTRSTSDIVWEFYASDRSLHWLGDVESLLGHTPGNLVDLEEALHPDEREETMSLIENFILSGEDVFLRYRIRCADGSYRNWEVHGLVTEWDENGKPSHWAGACTDITDRLAAEEDARELRGQLLHVSRIATLGELTTTLAHELNQPLTAILSNAQAALRLLDGDQPDLDEARAALRDIAADDQRAGDVIKHLRSFLKKHDFELLPLSLNELVREVVSLLQSELNRNRVQLSLFLPTDIPDVEGDRYRLQQVILNLMANAIESMTEEKGIPRKLAITTSRIAGNMIALSFCDTGKGIADMDPDALFDPFFTTKSDGMGMGLAICKSIIEGHGGQLKGRSNPGRGATFQFTLPIAPTSPS